MSQRRAGGLRGALAVSLALFGMAAPERYCTRTQAGARQQPLTQASVKRFMRYVHSYYGLPIWALGPAGGPVVARRRLVGRGQITRLLVVFMPCGTEASAR